MRTAVFNDIAFRSYSKTCNRFDFGAEINAIAKCIKDFNLESISVWRNWISEDIGGSTVGALLQDRSNNIDSSARSLILSKMTRNPFSDSIIDDHFEKNEELVSVLIDGAESIAFAASFISDLPLFSLAVDNFTTDLIKSDISVQNSSDEVPKVLERYIYNISKHSDVESVSRVFIDRQIKSVTTASEMLEFLINHNKIKVLPHASDQIAGLDGCQYKESIFRHLFKICEWSCLNGPMLFSSLPLNGSEESASTLNNSTLMEFRSFSNGKGDTITFSYHTKAAGGYRIYLSLEEEGFVIIGYVGPHLPTG